MHAARRFVPGTAAALLLLAALFLSACGDAGDTQGSQGGQPAAAGSGNDGALVPLPQADQAARQWWSDHESALARRDAAALTRLDADPGALVTVEALRVSLATGRAMIAQPRSPSAVRVHVPAQQSWPVPLLAVYDLPGSNGATEHIAVLLIERSRGAPLVALESASLDAAEPALDVDAAGYVRMIAPADQPAALGRSASDLPADYGRYMGALADGRPAPSPPPFADGPHTSGLAHDDATFITAVKAGQRGSIGSAGVGYIDLNFPTPVFALQGGGGLALFAEQRNETLVPTQGQAFQQDQSRRNYGIDLAPGQYGQIAIHAIAVVAVRIPPGGATMDVLGTGGGVYSEG